MANLTEVGTYPTNIAIGKVWSKVRPDANDLELEEYDLALLHTESS